MVSAASGFERIGVDREIFRQGGQAAFNGVQSIPAAKPVLKVSKAGGKRWCQGLDAPARIDFGNDSEGKRIPAGDTYGAPGEPDYVGVRRKHQPMHRPVNASFPQANFWMKVLSHRPA